MSPDEDEIILVECPNCSAEYEKESYCGECGYGQEVGELVEAEDAERRGADASADSSSGEAEPKPEPVYARMVEPRAFPVHEAAWCPYCVAWLGTFPSKEEARGYERALTDHPFEFCVKRLAKLNGSEEWRLRHEAGKRGSLAASKPSKPRVPAEEVQA